MYIVVMMRDYPPVAPGCKLERIQPPILFTSHIMTLYRWLIMLVALCVSACAARTETPHAATGTSSAATAVSPTGLSLPATPSPAATAAPRSKPAPAPAESRALPAHPDTFARVLAAEHNLPLAAIQAALRAANYNATVARLIAPPRPATPTAQPVRRNWPAYRARFVEPVRLRHGLAFWDEHADALARAERRYGVPAAVIAAIIGVETVYGRNMGNFPVLDALYTLAFSYPPHAARDRSDYFRSELAEYLAMTLRAGIDPTQLRGSYAGAIGIPQFMPGSIRRYAVAATPGATPDLVSNPRDAIESVANYLVQHGWQPGLPVFIDAQLPPEPSRLVEGGLVPTLSWRQLAAAGARTRAQPAMAGLVSATTAPAADWRARPLGVINLDHGATGHTEYRVATENFFAITLYNRSYFYATAVADLAHELQRARSR